jgi:hypothetical protein
VVHPFWGSERGGTHWNNSTAVRVSQRGSMAAGHRRGGERGLTSGDNSGAHTVLGEASVGPGDGPSGPTMVRSQRKQWWRGTGNGVLDRRSLEVADGTGRCGAPAQYSWWRQ